VFAQPIPFWTSDQVITYSELQKFRSSEYAHRSPALIQKVKTALLRFYNAPTKITAINALLELDEYAFELSCFNSEWVDFSTVVFELAIIPSHASIPWMYTYLSNMLNLTLERITNGRRNL
jgi:hypothetical protein